MSSEADKLYKLLPAIYRVRDAERGEPLKALCAVLAEQIAVLQEDLDQLYDDQFIETCAEWVAPYIGDLIGYRPIHGVTTRTVSARAEVANTIAYRRRKGTATMLEQLARDVTGWPARAVEFFQSLQTSQYMNHIRPSNAATPDLRRWEALERRDTAFNSLAHSVNVRRIETQRGRYNIPNAGLFLWRLEAFSATRSPAFRADDEQYLFSPLGHDLQLFARPRTETDITHLAEPVNVPEPISRRVLSSRLGLYYGPQRSIYVEADGVDTGIENIRVCDLSDDGGSWAHLPAARILIDPVLGRIAFPAVPAPKNVRVTFHHGFSAAIGGGEYERRSSFAIADEAGVTVQQGQSLQTGLDAVTGGGVMEFTDSGRYEETPSLVASQSSHIELRAANGHRPVWLLAGDLNVELNAGADVTLGGLLLTGGKVRILPGGGAGPRTLRLRHCTLVPGLALTRSGDPVFPDSPSLVVEAPDTTVEIDQCIIGGVRTLAGVSVRISNSIVDATADTRPAFSHPNGKAAGGTLTIVNSTMVGKAHTARMDLASNTIFLARLAPGDPWPHPVISEQNQQGCVRFSYAPLNSIVPRRYRCQPAGREVRERVRPAFTSLRFGRPGYAQLASFAPKEIRRGADDESEMGVFHDVFAPQREANLRIRLDEYLRFGLEAGIFYST